MKKNPPAKRTKARKSTDKDLPPRKAGQVKAGGSVRGDRGQQLQIALHG